VNSFELIIDKIESREARIGVIGLGYVGLPLALCFSESGFDVCGFESDREKVGFLERGVSYLRHISDKRIARALKENMLVTDEYSLASRCDAFIICVPTPLGKHFEPDLSHVITTLEELTPHLRDGQIICLESTTYPGTTAEEIVPRVQTSGFSVGEEIFVVYSPEREDPGNPNYSTATIPKVVGGHTDKCLAVGKLLYSTVINQVVPVSSTQVAELTKLVENIQRSVNIGLMNELKLVADKMSLDIFEVIEAASTKPFGFTPYYPGPGMGGHCIPIDPYYLAWKAQEYGLRTRIIELSGDINRNMPNFVVQKTLEALNSVGTPMLGSNIIILGVAYKKNVSDIRESPALEIIKLLLIYGAKVNYCDPFVASLMPTQSYNWQLANIDLDTAALNACDACILVTDHDAFDYDHIKEQCKLVIDCRGRYNASSNIVRA